VLGVRRPAVRKERVDRERRLDGLAVEVLARSVNEMRRSPRPNKVPGTVQAMINDEHVTVAEAAQ
jgi:hypothetical protein